MDSTIMTDLTTVNNQIDKTKAIGVTRTLPNISLASKTLKHLVIKKDILKIQFFTKILPTGTHRVDCDFN